jgi:hypothetical protein
LVRHAPFILPENRNLVPTLFTRVAAHVTFKQLLRHEGDGDRNGSSDAWSALEKGMRLRANLALLPLDDDAVVFSEEAQHLLRLNPPAALVFRTLQKGTAACELGRVLEAEGLVASEEAEQLVTATLDAFRSYGMLEDGPAAPVAWTASPDDDAETARLAADCAPYASFEPVAEQRYRLLETRALVRFGHLAQVRLVRSVIGHLATDDHFAPTIVIDINAKMLDNGHLRSDVYRDGIAVGRAPRLSQVAPIVKAALWQSAINAHDFLFYIHSGVVGTGASCLLLPAAAGSGKSSLTAALVHRGFRYFSDEVALVEATTFHVSPMPLAMCIKSTGWDLMARYFPGIWSLPVHVRSDGKILRYIPPPADAVGQRPMPIRHIIFPRYEQDAQTRLERVKRSEALGRLMGECLALRQRLDHQNVRQFVGWIAGIECYELTFSSLETAVQLLVEATGSSRCGLASRQDPVSG